MTFGISVLSLAAGGAMGYLYARIVKIPFPKTYAFVIGALTVIVVAARLSGG